MRYMLLTPGTGHFYCGSCLRDDALANGLRRLGHDVSVVPLYLPLVLEETGSEAAAARVRMGGINMYLQQKSRFARRLPRFLADLLDRPGLLRWAARRGNLTEAADLGEMTLSMLKGEDGRQVREVDKLVEWIASETRPDVLVISNILLSGIVRRLKARIGAPVVATLQGEAPFLDALPAAYREAAWSVVSDRAADIDAFVPVSSDYGTRMRERLGLDAGRVHVVHNGIDVARDFAAEPPRLAERGARTIGYVARMCRDKGLPRLVDAFLALKKRGSVPDLQLHVCGVMLAEDRAMVDELRALIDAAGFSRDAGFHADVDREQKLAMLRSVSVLSVPAEYGESFGLYLLEAMASGVPVVQPRHAAFPEILEATGGGLLCEPSDPESLADALEALLCDTPRAQFLADRGRRAVLDHFNTDRMAREFAALSNRTLERYR